MYNILIYGNLTAQPSYNTYAPYTAKKGYYHDLETVSTRLFMFLVKKRTTFFFPPSNLFSRLVQYTGSINIQLKVCVFLFFFSRLYDIALTTFSIQKTFQYTPSPRLEESWHFIELKNVNY